MSISVSPLGTIGTPEPVTLRESRDHLGDLVRRARYKGEQFVISDKGTDSAVLVSVDDYLHMRKAVEIAERAEERVILEEIDRRRSAGGHTYTFDEVWTEVTGNERE